MAAVQTGVVLGGADGVMDEMEGGGGVDGTLQLHIISTQIQELDRDRYTHCDRQLTIPLRTDSIACDLT